MNKKLWYTLLVVVVGVFFSMELPAILDEDPETLTLTATILDTVPADIFFIIVGGGFMWVLWHFGKYYIRRDNNG